MPRVLAAFTGFWPTVRSGAGPRRLDTHASTSRVVKLCPNRTDERGIVSNAEIQVSFFLYYFFNM